MLECTGVMVHNVDMGILGVRAVEVSYYYSEGIKESILGDLPEQVNLLAVTSPVLSEQGSARVLRALKARPAVIMLEIARMHRAGGPVPVGSTLGVI